MVNLMILTVYSSAQDIHFSQLQTVPQLVNPATTGIMESGFRMTNAYRNQWRQLDFPYVTNFLSAEGRVNILGQAIGIGGYFLHDHSSNFYLTADKFFFSLSYTRYLRNHQFVVGLQPGWVLKSLDSRSISFGSQFDPAHEVFDPSLPSGETLPADGMNYFDLNAGVYWRAKINRLFPAAGFSIQHVNLPVESFYDQNDSTRLPLKYSFHGNISIPITEKYRLLPFFMFTTTRGASECLGGLIASYHPSIPTLAINKLFGMAEFRMDPFQTVDALIFGGGIGYAAFDLCISYDLTVSSLSEASRFQRAFEISLIYTLSRQGSGSETEPCFML